MGDLYRSHVSPLILVSEAKNGVPGHAIQYSHIPGYSFLFNNVHGNSWPTGGSSKI